jgi:hypothetical protein
VTTELANGLKVGAALIKESKREDIENNAKLHVPCVELLK